MSRLFYDQLISFTEIEITINDLALDKQEKHELWRLIDNIIHHRLLHVVLENLKVDYHEKFFELYQQSPASELVFDFIRENGSPDLEAKLRQEMDILSQELLELF